jgi:hypothetical protein
MTLSLLIHASGQPEKVAAAWRAAKFRLLQVVLADAVGQQDQPMNRLAFRSGEVGTIRQTRGRRSKFGPAPKEIEQVARSGWLAFLFFWSFGVPTGSAHVGRLVQAVVRGRVKKA